MGDEIERFHRNPEHPRSLSGYGYNYRQSDNGTWYSADTGSEVYDRDLAHAISVDNHKNDYLALEAIAAQAEAYAKSHGHYPPDYDKKIAEAHKKIAESYGDTGPGCTTFVGVCGIVGIVGAGIVKGVLMAADALKPLGEFVLGAGIVAVGAATGAAIAAGTYKASNFVWEKVTGETSRLRGALTTAALFAAAAGGVYIANHPSQIPPAGQEAGSPLQTQFHTAAPPLTIGQTYEIKTHTMTRVTPGGMLSSRLLAGDCVKVQETLPGSASARVFTGRVLGWVDIAAVGAAKPCTPAPH